MRLIIITAHEIHVTTVSVPDDNVEVALRLLKTALDPSVKDEIDFQIVPVGLFEEALHAMKTWHEDTNPIKEKQDDPALHPRP